MKEKYSVVSVRLNELKNHYLLKILFSFVIPFVVLTIIYIVYVLPLKYDVFYSSFIDKYIPFIYTHNSSQNIINISFWIIILLICFLISFICYFYANKKYNKLYKLILMDELKLNDYYQYDYNIYYLNKKLDVLYKYIPFVSIDKECVLSLKKTQPIIFFQLFLKGIKGNNAAMIIYKSKKQISNFLEINTYSRCPYNSYLNKNIFEFNYDNYKYSSEIKVYSSYSTKTNEICDKEFLKEFDSLQRYVRSKIILIAFEDIIALIIPGWKFTFIDNIYKKIDGNNIERKVENIDIIYNYLHSLSSQILEKGESLNEK